MSRTIVKVKTYMCPEGIGNVNSHCRFHRAWDNLPDDNKCPHCNLELAKAVEDGDRITITVIGPEDIEHEITERGLADSDEISSYRTARTLEMEAAIIEARLHEDN